MITFNAGHLVFFRLMLLPRAAVNQAYNSNNSRTCIDTDIGWKSAAVARHVFGGKEIKGQVVKKVEEHKNRLGESSLNSDRYC